MNCTTKPTCPTCNNQGKPHGAPCSHYDGETLTKTTQEYRCTRGGCRQLVKRVQGGRAHFYVTTRWVVEI